MKWSLIITGLMALAACIDESELKPIVPISLIHANSAKVWLLDEVEYANGEIVKQQIHQNKLTYTFFRDYSYVTQKLIHFGTSIGEKGSFNLSIERSDTILRLDQKKKGKEVFKLHRLNHLEFYFQSVKSQNIYRLKSYPNPF